MLRAESNQGVAWNHNRLVHEARGEYFKWAAHDDRHKPSWISACVGVLDEHDDVVLCYTNTIDIDGDGDVIKQWPTTNRASSIDPIERFCDVMLNERQCFPFYGLIRTEVLRSTMMVGAYSGSDHPMLAEIALQGRFVEIAEPLFEHREHVERSVTAFPYPRDRIVLFRPNKAGRMSFPRWRMARDFVTVLVRAPLGFRAKLRAVPAFGSWAKQWWRALLREPRAQPARCTAGRLRLCDSPMIGRANLARGAKPLPLGHPAS